MRKYNQTLHIAVFIFVSMLMVFIPCSAADQAFSARDLTYITEQFPPYNYQEDGKLQGISVDLLEMAWTENGRRSEQERHQAFALDGWLSKNFERK